MSSRPADSAFTMLFNVEEHVVDLYEVLTGERLDPTRIESVQLKDGFVKSKLYNDVSFVTENNELFVLIEHQSTPNPNMGFRILEYYVKLVSERLKEKKVNLFGTKQIKIPKARFFVVYNGENEMSDLPLLDLGDVKVTAGVKNIHFDKLENKSTTSSVAGYARFIDLVQKGQTPYEALEQMLSEGYLTEFFKEKERRNMFAETYSYENELKYVGRQEGILEGLQKGMEEGMQKGLQKGKQEGTQNEKLEIARKGILNGFDVKSIVLLTELDESVILELQNELAGKKS